MNVPARLRKVGGSIMVAIPPVLLETLGLAPDSAVGLSVRDGRLIVEPETRRRYSLDELLVQARRSGKRLPKDSPCLLAIR